LEWTEYLVGINLQAKIMKERILYTLIFTMLTISQMSFSQSISKKEFKKRTWFCSNKDSIFFKSDTIQLIKYSNLIKKDKHSEDYEESTSFYDVESIQLYFLQNKYMNFYKRDFHMYSLKLYKWIFNKKDSILTLKDKNKIDYSFKIISFKDLEFENKGQKFTTKEMILVKQ